MPDYSATLDLTGSFLRFLATGNCYHLDASGGRDDCPHLLLIA